MHTVLAGCGCRMPTVCVCVCVRACECLNRVLIGPKWSLKPRLVVGDMFVDAKARHICSMQETRLDLLALFLGALWPQARDGDLQMAFF
jgi:hypothetical protein